MAGKILHKLKNLFAAKTKQDDFIMSVNVNGTGNPLTQEWCLTASYDLQPDNGVWDTVIRPGTVKTRLALDNATILSLHTAMLEHSANQKSMAADLFPLAVLVALVVLVAIVARGANDIGLVRLAAAAIIAVLYVGHFM